MSEVRAVMFKRGRFWIAQCLEFDICVQALKLQDLQYELGRALIGVQSACDQEKIGAFSSLPRAPQQYWDLWNESHVKVEFDAPDPFPSGAQLPKTALRLAA
ncbi:MAG TPA: hypothetical protein VGQ52_13890 [Gemmatimonadaceae bacterium]|jgi:hypothetical protein|nr:hypothetical protein [Gemmatimonadaceae bacterium]